MVKTHLPAHMDTARQWMKPKHQLLIMKCYPRLPKNSSADVKPNGSELSYLLYYASTRRSKLQKVGSFLEQKTARDLYKWQSARVLVTLQILTALLENKAVGVGSGFTLIAPYVLKIIREILQTTNDISLVEATLETWEVFCQHQDQATLSADREYRQLYEDLVRRYATLASKDGGKKMGKGTQAVAVQDEIRLREAGLGAIKSVLLSDALASESGRQLNVVVPAILSNVRGQDEGWLIHLLRLSKRHHEDEKDKAVARRMSMATVRTFTNLTDVSAEADPRQAEGTAHDADELAEEEAAILALDCLRAVFTNENRPQVRSATNAVLRYLAELKPQRPSTRMGEQQPSDSWATKLFEICTAWTPVQDRFILMVTAVETLVRIPLRESDLEQHLLFTRLISHILSSDLNLIGLSIMDILLSLTQQILRVLQLNGPLVRGRSSAVQLFSDQEEIRHPPSSSTTQTINDLPSEARIRLIERLKHCLSDLATHVYYTDQVGDMISAILLRLKPNPIPGAPQNPAVTAAAIEEPKQAVTEVASNISLPARERSNSTSSGFFSFDTARQIALDAVRDVLLVANSAKSKSGGGVGDSRSRVPISIWEGTQWLLRDPATSVRRAYVEALTTWLQLETKKSDARVKEPKDKEKKQKKDSVLARRAVSNASQKKEKQGKKATNTFLQLLHLAVFEDALQFASNQLEGDQEVVSLHYLLNMLVQKLGVNAIASGLPMIFALQDEIANTEVATARVRIGSLVYGYLWTLTEEFDFDVSPVGAQVSSEVKKRRETGLWTVDVNVPAKALMQAPASDTAPDLATTKEGLEAFEQRQALVDCISASYSTAVDSPSPSAPGSPGKSPGRRTSASLGMDRTASSYLSVKLVNSVLPEKVKDAMMETWTRQGCLAAIAAAAPKSVSLSGSRTSPSYALAAGNHRQLLAAVNAPGQRSPIRKGSLPRDQVQSRAGTAQQQRQQGFGPRLHSQSPDRRPSASASASRRVSSSAGGARHTTRVDDLKRVLSGGMLTTDLVARHPNTGEDTASESMVDVEGDDFESESGEYATPPQFQSEAAAAGTVKMPETIPEEKQPAVSFAAPTQYGATEETVPILPLWNDFMTNERLSSGAPPPVPNGEVPTKPPPSRGGASIKSNKGRNRKELAALLAGIGSDSPAKEESKSTGIGRPPY